MSRLVHTCVLLALMLINGLPAFAQQDESAGVEPEADTIADDADTAPDVDPEQPDSGDAKPTPVPAPDGATDPDRDAESTQLPARDFDPVFDSPLKAKSREELVNEGFVFSDASKLASSSTATVMALTVGALIHGIGHIYAGDSRTGSALLYTETLGIVAMIGSGVFILADGGAGTLTGVMAPVFQLGFGAFMMSWFLDVIGSVQGDLRSLPRSTAHTEGIEFKLSYGFLSASGTPTRHALRADLSFDFDQVWIRAGTIQDVLLTAGWYKAETGVRLFRVRPQTFLTLTAASDFYNVTENGAFQRLGVEGRVGGQFDLGVFYSQLTDVAVGMWVGYGNHWFSFDSTIAFDDFESANAFVAYRTFFHFNLSERLNFEWAYGEHPGNLLSGSSRLLGVAEVWFNYQTDFGSFQLGTELGDGVALWIGGGLEL